MADAIGFRVRDAVGEKHWEKARQIQKQLAANQQRKKLKAMQVQRLRNQQKKKMQQKTQTQAQQGGDHQQQGGASAVSAARDHEAMDVAMTLSGMSKEKPALPSPGVGNNTTTNNDNSSGSEGGSNSGTATPSSGHLPLRKRITSAGSSRDMSGPDFTKMRR